MSFSSTANALFSAKAEERLNDFCPYKAHTYTPHNFHSNDLFLKFFSFMLELF